MVAIGELRRNHKAGNQSLSSTKVAELAGISKHSNPRSRQQLVREYRLNKDSDEFAVREDDRPELVEGARRQPESVKQHLLLTNRLPAVHAMDELKDIEETAANFRRTDRLFVKKLPPTLPRDPELVTRLHSWGGQLAAYKTGPWLSVHPVGTVVEGSQVGALIVRTVVRRLDVGIVTADMDTFEIPEHVEPVLDTWIQAMLCLLARQDFAFAEVSMVHEDWVFMWRLQRDNIRLRTFLEKLQPFVLDWGRIRSAVEAEESGNPILMNQGAYELDKILGGAHGPTAGMVQALESAAKDYVKHNTMMLRLRDDGNHVWETGAVDDSTVCAFAHTSVKPGVQLDRFDTPRYPFWKPRQVRKQRPFGVMPVNEYQRARLPSGELVAEGTRPNAAFPVTHP